MPGLIIPTFEQEPGRLYVSDRQLQTAYLDIGDQIVDSGQKIDVIVGAPRGCLSIMGVLAQRLSVSADNIVTIGLTSYEDGSETASDTIRIGQMPSEGAVKDKNCVIVDDLKDTGITDFTMRDIVNDQGAASISTAVVFYKPEKMIVGQPPEFYWKETNDWVVFPWERQQEYGDARSVLKSLGASEAELLQLRSNFIAALAPAQQPLLGVNDTNIFAV